MLDFNRYIKRGKHIKSEIGLFDKFNSQTICIELYEGLADAIEHAINRRIDEDVLKEFLINRREEVAKVTNLDFTFEKQIELVREEAKAAEIFKSVQEGDYGVTRGAEKLGVTEAEFVEKMEAAGYKIPTFVQLHHTYY